LLVTSSTGFTGVMVALVTPVDEDGRVDTAAVERLVGRVVGGGVDGISPVGSTGEGPKLTSAERVSLTAQVRALVPAGLPVVPGVPAANLTDALSELKALAGAGASAALVSPPSYYPLPDEAVLRLYEALADRSPLPLLLYNIPAFTKVRIAPEAAAALAAHPNVIGMKDSSRDMEYQQQVIQACAGMDGGFNVLTGTDTLLVASLVLGASGAIVASANLAPELPVGVYHAFTSGDAETARQLQEQLSRVVATCRRAAFPAGWKAALEIAGVCSAHPVPPGAVLSGSQRAELAAGLAAALPAGGFTG
jgi:dihydrodipicolinate synthase/N-acetylneuraminate lyase